MLLVERRQEIHVEGVKSRAMAHSSDFSIEQTCNVVGHVRQCGAQSKLINARPDRLFNLGKQSTSDHYEPRDMLIRANQPRHRINEQIHIIPDKHHEL
jgi:hypothetical protein